MPDMALSQATLVAAAHQEQHRQGYDYDFVRDVTDYKCEICLLVACQPVNVRCGTYCETCLTEWSKRSDECPKRCGVAHDPDDDQWSLNQWLIAKIRGLDVRCSHEGCTHKTVVSRMEDHLQSCPFQLLPCPNQCHTGSVQLQHLPHHLTDCERRQVDCTICKKSMEFVTLAAHTNNVYQCRAYVECPNGCLVRENRSLLQTLPANIRSFVAALSENIIMPAGYPAQHNSMPFGYLHSAFCPRQICPCGLCKKQMQLQVLQKHVAEECSKRNVPCNVCRYMIEYDAMETHKNNIYLCASYQPCTNGCLISENAASTVSEEVKAVIAPLPTNVIMPVKRSMFDQWSALLGISHYSTCPRAVVECHVCQASMQRIQLPAHLRDNAVDHITTLSRSVDQLKDIVQTQQTALRILETANQTLIQRVTAIESELKMPAAIPFASPPPNSAIVAEQPQPAFHFVL